MAQPYPNPSGFNTSLSVWEYANTVTDGWMGTLFSIAMVLVIFTLCYFNRYRVSDCFLISFFISFILSSLLWASGVIAGKIIVILLLFTVASAIYSYLDD